MKIEFNKITKFSKILAAIIFIFLPFLYFFAGYKLGMIVGESRMLRTFMHIIDGRERIR